MVASRDANSTIFARSRLDAVEVITSPRGLSRNAMLRLLLGKRALVCAAVVVAQVDDPMRVGRADGERHPPREIRSINKMLVIVRISTLGAFACIASPGRRDRRSVDRRLEQRPKRLEPIRLALRNLSGMVGAAKADRAVDRWMAAERGCFRGVNGPPGCSSVAETVVVVCSPHYDARPGERRTALTRNRTPLGVRRPDPRRRLAENPRH